MPSRIYVDQIGHTNETVALEVESTGNMILQKDLKFGSLAVIRDSSGNPVIEESNGSLLFTNVKLSANGGISDSSGNPILTESGGNVSISNVRLSASGAGITDSSGNAVLTESAGTVTIGSSVSVPSSAGGVPAGAIMSFGMGSAPTGWVVCNGAVYSQSDYSELFTAIGSAWVRSWQNTESITTGDHRKSLSSGNIWIATSTGTTSGTDIEDDTGVTWTPSTDFLVPDLRGAFLRGDGTHGYMRDRVNNLYAGIGIGSLQKDTTARHRHWYNFIDDGSGTTDPQGTEGATVWNYVDYDYPDHGQFTDWYIYGYNSTDRNFEGTEDRPFNATIQYCIKY